MLITIVTSDECNICTELKKEMPASKEIRYINADSEEAKTRDFDGVPSAFLDNQKCQIMKDDTGFFFNCFDNSDE